MSFISFLEFQQSQGRWPVKAKFGNVSFIFSNGHKTSRQSSRYHLRLLLAFAVFVTAFSLLVAQIFFAPSFNLWIKTQPNFYFWVIIISTASPIGMLTVDYFLRSSVTDFNKRLGLNQKPYCVDVYNFFDARAKRSWWRSQHTPLAAELLLALLKDYKVRQIFLRAGANIKDLEALLSGYGKLSVKKSDYFLTKLPFFAMQYASQFGQSRISNILLLCALKKALPQDHVVESIFVHIGINIIDVEILAALEENAGSAAFTEPQNEMLSLCKKIAVIENHSAIFFRYGAIKESLDVGKSPEKAISLLVQAAMQIKKIPGHRRTIYPEDLRLAKTSSAQTKPLSLQASGRPV